MVELSQLPTAVDVTVYKYNYYDNQIWTLIKNELDWIDAGEDTMLVSVRDLIDLIESKYSLMLDKISALGTSFLHKDVNGVYFLYMMCYDMENLKYVKLTLSLKKKFNRLAEIEEQKVLKFDFKILTITVRLRDFFSREEVKVINNVLLREKMMLPNVPFIQQKMHPFMSKLEDLMDINMATDGDQTEGDLIGGLLDILDPKLENDNPLMMLVTDY